MPCYAPPPKNTHRNSVGHAHEVTLADDLDILKWGGEGFGFEWGREGQDRAEAAALVCHLGFIHPSKEAPAQKQVSTSLDKTTDTHRHQPGRYVTDAPLVPCWAQQ